MNGKKIQKKREILWKFEILTRSFFKKWIQRLNCKVNLIYYVEKYVNNSIKTSLSFYETCRHNYEYEKNIWR